MIELRWLEKEGRTAGHTTHYYMPPDDIAAWFMHPYKIGIYRKQQYRDRNQCRHYLPAECGTTEEESMQSFIDSEKYNESLWQDVPIVEADIEVTS
jgi:hypothetical protein